MSKSIELGNALYKDISYTILWRFEIAALLHKIKLEYALQNITISYDKIKYNVLK